MNVLLPKYDFPPCWIPANIVSGTKKNILLKYILNTKFYQF